MNKIKNIFKKSWFPAVTVLNTIYFLSLFIELLGASATPMTAFAAICVGGISLLGWFSIAYEVVLNKVQAQRVKNEK